MNLSCGAVLDIVQGSARLAAPGNWKAVEWGPCPVEKCLQTIRNARWRENHFRTRNRVFIYKHVDVWYGILQKAHHNQVK